jgi:carboxylesterase
MIRSRWQDWVASVEDGYHILNRVTDNVFVMGLSMGGNLALLFASRKPVAGVVAISTPYALPPDPRLPFIDWLYRLFPSVSKDPSDWHNTEAAQDHVDYPFYPTRSIIELRDLLVEMRAALPKINVPVLLVHSHQDGSVNPENMLAIYNHLCILDKHMLWVEDSGHVIPREPERERVFEAVDEFICRVSDSSP